MSVALIGTVIGVPGENFLKKYYVHLDTGEYVWLTLDTELRFTTDRIKTKKEIDEITDELFSQFGYN